MNDVTMQTRLAIVLQMADACAFSHCGLSHVDSRITNIPVCAYVVTDISVTPTLSCCLPQPQPQRERGGVGEGGREGERDPLRQRKRPTVSAAGAKSTDEK